MDRVRVLQLIAGLDIGGQCGGAEKFACQIARLLDPARFEVIVFVLRRYGTEAENHWIRYLEDSGVSVQGLIPSQGSLLRDTLPILRELIQVEQSFCPQITHSHSERTDLFNALVCCLLAKPTAVRTVHIDEQWKTHRHFGAFFNQLIAPFLFRVETAVSVQIKTLLDRRLVARILKKSASLVYNGIDQSLYEQAIDRKRPIFLGRKLTGTQKSEYQIGIIGRIDEQKGHSYLLEAVANLPSDLPYHLWVIGSGPYQEKIQHQVEDLGLITRVSFLGNRSDVFDLLPELNLLVSSSLWEGFPTVILEAMASGVPVVATAVSGSTELVEDYKTGRLVLPRDIQGLKEAIYWMGTHQNLSHDMAMAARQRIAPYTLQHAVQKLSEIYIQTWHAKKPPG